jgi:hypothetical protein
MSNGWLPGRIEALCQFVERQTSHFAVYTVCDNLEAFPLVARKSVQPAIVEPHSICSILAPEEQ